MIQVEGGKRSESVSKHVIIKLDHDIRVGKRRMGVMKRQRMDSGGVKMAEE